LIVQITIPEVVRQLSTLPPERIAEVYDFILFLKTRQIQAVDERDDWSEEDMRDAASASLNYAKATLLAEEAAVDSTG
jgi:hypothetical protein